MTGFPAPGATLHADFATWPAGREIHRVHHARFGSTDFNASSAGSARFSPIADAASGKTIPTLYGGGSFEGAAMETVFHDVPYTAGFKTYDKAKLSGRRASIIRPLRDLLLVDLSSKALRKLGIPRSGLIECDAADYPKTRIWAVALHAQCPKADGLSWVSHQDDEARALMLFGDRLKRTDLAEVQPPADIVSDPALFQQLLDLAQRIGVYTI